MCDACLIEDMARRGLTCIAADAGLDAVSSGGGGSMTAPVPEPEEVAPGVFFLKGETRYFQDGTRAGAAGSIRRLMCNNGWVVLGDHVLVIDANMPGRADAIRAALTADPAAAGHVIPHGADLPALSLQAQVERTFDQIRSSRDELR